MTGDSELEIIVIDDHPLFRDGLTGILATLFVGSDIAQAGDMAALTELLAPKGLRRPAPDLLVLDVMFPGFDAVQDLPSLRAQLPTTVIVVVSMIEDNQLIDSIVATGINGFVSKSVPPETLSQAFADVMAGRSLILR